MGGGNGRRFFLCVPASARRTLVNGCTMTPLSLHPPPPQVNIPAIGNAYLIPRVYMLFLLNGDSFSGNSAWVQVTG
jgi:hypothetical protein